MPAGAQPKSAPRRCRVGEDDACTRGARGPPALPTSLQLSPGSHETGGRLLPPRCHASPCRGFPPTAHALEDRARYFFPECTIS